MPYRLKRFTGFHNAEVDRMAKAVMRGLGALVGLISLAW
jgi:hypothetical protein